MNHLRITLIALTLALPLATGACSKSESNEQKQSTNSPGNTTSASLVSGFHVTENPVQLQWSYAGNSAQTFQIQACYPTEGCVDYVQIDCGTLADCTVKDGATGTSRANYELTVSGNQNTFQYQYKDLIFDTLGEEITRVQIRVGNGDWVRAQ